MSLLIFWLLAIIAWGIFSEIIIWLVMYLGKIEIKGKRASLTFYKWILFYLGALGLALNIFVLRWFNFL